MNQNKNRRLHVIQGNEQRKIVKGMTCFSAQAKFGVACQRQRCKQWINHVEGQNCVLIAAQQGPHTLQKIGQIYGLTRMRICQIEKELYKELRSNQ